MASIIFAIIIFSILVVVHEFGHMFVAKKAGIKVEEFAIGMGPKIISKQFGETLYSLRIFPIGGFCKMLGEDEDIKDPRAFNNKKCLPRFLVLGAGAFMNFVLAFVIILILVLLEGYAEPRVREVSPDFGAYHAGIQKDDQITRIDGKRIWVYEDIKLALFDADGSPIEVAVKRTENGATVEKTFSVTPTLTSGEYILGFIPIYRLGMLEKAEEDSIHDKAGILGTLSTSLGTMTYYVKSAYVGFIKILTRQVDPQQVAGPIGIVNMIGDSYELGMEAGGTSLALQTVARFGAMLSANLGALNLLPIPALDGARMLFVLIEGIRRKPLPPEKEGLIHLAGFVFLLLLMVIVAYNDISRITGSI